MTSRPKRDRGVKRTARDQHHGESSVVSLRDYLLNNESDNVSLLEIEQMEIIRCRFRGRVRHMIRLTRQWEAAYERETNALEKIYSAQDGIFIRRQLQDALALYDAVNKDYHQLRRHYLAILCQPPHFDEAA